jgi:hypothetical protein
MKDYPAEDKQKVYFDTANSIIFNGVYNLHS